MGFNPQYRTVVGEAAGTLTANPAAGTTTGATNSLRLSAVKDGTLSGLATLDAETNTITLLAKWQVSMDDSTWYDLRPENGAAYVVAATGTGGADASVSLVIPAPSATGWRWARMAVVNGVVQGEVADTFVFTYQFLKANAFAA